MKGSIAVTAVVAMLAFAPAAFGSDPGEKYEHFKGKPSETLSEAVGNFSEYNAKLDTVLDGKVDENAIHEVHELTYTLETALAKINEELAVLAEKLEELHKASEKHDPDGVIRLGREYLEVSRQIVK